MPITTVPGSGTTADVGYDNPFPPSQCTWWADERYHQLTGYYVPTDILPNGTHFGNADEWYGAARAAGWDTSSYPPSGPAIIVLQPGVQLADPQYGHVGVVESVNADGTVTTSDLNWGPDAAARSQVSTVVFRTGPGVNFIWVPNATQLPGSGPINKGAVTTFLQSVAGNQLNPSSDVASVLVGIDAAFTLKNPFDLASYGETIPGLGVGPVTIPNPFDWAGLVMGNIFSDALAFFWRVAFFCLGGLILYKVASNFIDFQALEQNAAQQRDQMIQTLEPLVGGLLLA